MKKLTLRVLSLLAVAGASSAFGQTSYSYDFGTGTGTYSTSGISTSFLPAPATGGGNSMVRVGSGGGSLALLNPGNTSLGSGTELSLTAPTGTSVTKFAISDYSDPLTQFTISFDMVLSGGSSGNLFLFAGNGTSYASANGFSGADSFAGIRWAFGASNAITTNVRTGGSWVTTGITGTPFSQSSVYSVTIVGNNGTSSVGYTLSGSQTIASNTFDLWVNGTLIGNDIGKAQLAASTAIDSFMFYGESSTGNVANIRLDNLTYGSALPIPEPSSFAALAGVGALGFCALRRRRSA